MAFINTTSAIGTVINNMTVEMTGSLFLTLMAILIFLIVIGLSVGMPLELIIPLTLPFVIAGLVVSSAFVGVLAFYVVYTGLLIARHFWLT